MLKIFLYINLILANFWGLLTNTIDGTNILLKSFWFWTREFWKNSKFQVCNMMWKLSLEIGRCFLKSNIVWFNNKSTPWGSNRRLSPGVKHSPSMQIYALRALLLLLYFSLFCCRFLCLMSIVFFLGPRGSIPG